MNEKDPLQNKTQLFNHLIDVEYGDILLVRKLSKSWLLKIPFIKHKEFCSIGLFMSGNTIITINRFLQEEARLFNSEDYVIMRHVNTLNAEDKKMLYNCQEYYISKNKSYKHKTKLQRIFNKIKSGLFSTRTKETSLMISEIYLRAGCGLQVEERPLGDLLAYYNSKQLVKIFDSREA